MFANCKKVKMININPYEKTYYPFDKNENYLDTQSDSMALDVILNNAIKDKYVEYNFVEGYFPLARGKNLEDKNNDANKIIDVLVLVNAIGSQCYGIFKTIIDLRRIKNNQTYIFGISNIMRDADCDIGTLLFEKDETGKIIPKFPDYY